MDVGYGVDPLRERPVVSGLPAESATRERYADENRRKDEVVSKQLVNFAKRKQIYKKTRRLASSLSFFLRLGGEEEIRTLDPHVANVMLYQLSYFPIRGNRR